MSKIIVNESPVDQFTLVHGAAGMIARQYGLSLGATFALGFLWDYWLEPVLKTSHPTWFPYPSQDTPAHAFIDAIVPGLTWMAYDAYLKRVK